MKKSPLDLEKGKTEIETGLENGYQIQLEKRNKL